MSINLHSRVSAGILLAALFATNSCVAGELGDLLWAALEQPAVKAVNSEVDAARAQKEAATNRYFGSGSLSYGWHRYENLRVVGFLVPGGPPALLSDKIDQSGLNYSVPIDLFGVLSAGQAKARQDLVVARLQAEQQSLFKLHQTATAYYALQALLAQKKALGTYRNQIESAYLRIKNEVDLGKAPGVEAKYAESEIARLEADEETLRAAVQQYQAELEETTGTTSFTPKLTAPRIPKWEVVVSASLLPLKIAEARQASARAYAEEGKRSLLPSISLDASYYHIAVPGGDYREIWDVGGIITLPLDAQQYKKAQARDYSSEAASEQSQATLREAMRQAVHLRTTYDSALSDAHAMEKEVAYREQVVTVEREMQRLGNQTLENLFRHEHDLLEAQYRLAQAKATAAGAWSAMQTIAGTSPEAYISEVDTP